jgi:RNA polymerase sigma factor (sigma-70 family)
MTDSQQLLADYAESRSEAAFSELVGRYIDLVYSTAVRLVDGDTHLAEDLSQMVFLDLARMARTISPQVMLGGWLHRHTCFLAARMLRANRRRQTRERLSVEIDHLPSHSDANLKLVAPILDEAINALGSDDRAAILLRFFEDRDFRSIGESLGSTEEAARKRVTRALEKLQSLLGKRGVAFSAAALGTALAGGAVSAAPAGLAASLSATVLATSAATGSGWAILNFMATAKIKTALVSSLVVASTVSTIVLHQRAEARVRAADLQSQQQTNQLGDSQSEFERLSRLVAARTGPAANGRDELLRMRAEVAALRKQIDDLASLQQDNAQLRAALKARRELPFANAPKNFNDPEIRARSLYCRDLAMALLLYASDHQEQFPNDFAAATKYLKEAITEPGNLTPAQFEIVYHGSRDALTNYAHPSGILLLREKRPWKSSEGKWLKGYAGSDGGGFLHSEPNGDFEAWEKKHILEHPKE